MSKIEWTGETWNPVAGCSIVSPGCTHCYAMKMAHRLAAMGVPHYAGLTKVVNGNAVWTGKIAQAPDAILLKPARRKKPTMWFVNSMSDLFHEDVPDEWIDRVFAVMAECPQHTFQVLTKRSARMRAYMTSYAAGERQPVDIGRRICLPMSLRPIGSEGGFVSQAPPNVWLGVSAERQQEADARIPDLLATPAAVRFVSAEPLLGPIRFWGDNGEGLLRGPGVVVSGGMTPSTPDGASEGYDDSYAGLDWVIVGGESGHGARPMHFEWARSIVTQCREVGVAVFVKQMGRSARSNRHDAVQATALGAGWRADGPGAPEGIVSFQNRKGGDQIEWPSDLRVREMPPTAEVAA